MSFAREEATKFTLSVIGDLWRWPWWWYTTGATRVGKWCLAQMHDTEERLAIRLFLKYFFKPMYGDYTWSGRLISLGMRFILIIIKSVKLAFWSVWYMVIFILWLIVPPVSLVMIFYV